MTKMTMSANNSKGWAWLADVTFPAKCPTCGMHALKLLSCTTLAVHVQDQYGRALRSPTVTEYKCLHCETAVTIKENAANGPT